MGGISFDAFIQALGNLGHDRKGGTGDQLYFQCPAHDDKHASLSVNRLPDGTAQYKCHAGCTSKDVREPLGLNGRRAVRDSTPSTIYIYADENGVPVRGVKRLPGKRFSQFQIDPTTQKHIPNTKGAREIPYHLDLIIKAKSERPNDPVYIVEGEKDADTLIALGLLATTNAGGAGKWRDLGAHFTNRAVIILPDNDAPGRKHGEEVAVNLAKHGAASIKVINLPRAEEKEDVTDWLQKRGGSLNELQALISSATLWVAGSGALVLRSLSDTGNKNRLIDNWGDRLRYITALSTWALYEGGTWRRRKEIELKAAEDVARVIYMEAENADRYSIVKAGEVALEDPASDLRRWAHRSLSAQSIANTARLAKAALHIEPGEFDQDIYLLCFPNGTLELLTGIFREHRTGDLISRMIPYNYNPDATCPIFDSFMVDFCCKQRDPSAALEYLWRWVGYILTGDTTEEKFLILYGDGENGKSTFVNTLVALLGPLGATCESDNLSLKNEGRHTQWLSRLDVMRVIDIQETQGGTRINEAFIKKFVGGDKIVAREMFGSDRQFNPNGKLIFSTNNKPIIKDNSRGMWRRIQLFHCNHIVETEKRDETIKRRIIDGELPGIMAKAARYCLEWKRTRLNPPQEIIDDTMEYRADSDEFGQWIGECLIHCTGERIDMKIVATMYRDTFPSHRISNQLIGKKCKEKGLRTMPSNGRTYLMDYKQNPEWESNKSMEYKSRSGISLNDNHDDSGAMSKFKHALPNGDDLNTELPF